MAIFSYAAKDPSGKSVKGTIEAEDRSQVLNILRERKLIVLKVREEARREGILAFFGGRKVVMDDIVVIFRQLATMIESGIPVVTSLDILAEQAENLTLKRVIREVRDAVNAGSSLSDAMMKHTAVFSSLFVNMIKAGESSGTLDVILDRIATYIEKSSVLQKKVKAALVYPTVVSAMAFIITLVMILKVIPVFKEIFSGFGAKLPRPTQFLINLSDFVRAYFILMVISFAGVFALARWYFSTPKGKYNFDVIKLKLPVFGPLMRKVAISKFSRTLSTLVKSGVPILASLDIVSKTSGNLVIEGAIAKVKDNVRDGESIASPLDRSGIFPPMVTRMVSVGEKSGQLEKMLAKISDFYDTQVDTAVNGLTSLIEPLIIAFLGVVIGSIVLCMFLPIFKISTIINI